MIDFMNCEMIPHCATVTSEYSACWMMNWGIIVFAIEFIVIGIFVMWFELKCWQEAHSDYGKKT